LHGPRAQTGRAHAAGAALAALGDFRAELTEARVTARPTLAAAIDAALDA
jgi:hypothetical protein